MTRRKARAILVLIAVALTATACGNATGAGPQAGSAYGTPASSMPATADATSGAVQTAALKAEHTKAGTVLAGRQGLTLYYYTADKPHSGTSACTGGCASAWPPLAAPVKAPAGVRLPGPMGMITRPGGVKQVTVNGYPVYYYAGDKAPGQVTGNGAGGSWHVIKVRAVTGHAFVLKVERTRAGTVLAGRQGLTLYYYTADKPHSGTSACTGGCAVAWPPLKAPVKAPAGVKLPGPIAMITRADGTRQVTVNGYPAYYYAGDKAPGQVTGNGAGGSWHVIKVTMKSGSTGSTAPKATATPATTTGGGGYGY